MVADPLSMGTKFWGTICPWGLEVGDQKSGDQMGLGPNESQPNEGINQRYLKNWANVADKICFGRTYKFGIGI